MSTDEEPARLGAKTRSYGEHQQHKAERRQERYREYAIQEAITEGREALVADDYATVLVLCTDAILPRLDIDEWSVDAYHDRLDDSRLGWSYEAVTRLLDYGRDLLPAALRISRRGESHRRKRQLQLAGWRSSDDVVAKTIHEAFVSVESAAVAEGTIPGELSQSSQTLGLDLEVGLMWQPFDYETPDEVRVSNPDLHPPFTMSVGIPGNGKSTSVDTLAEDAYAAGVKVIDLLDFGELENGLYDVPSDEESLADIRSQLGLPETFADHPEYERPDLEILHPLCPALCESQLPYDTESEEFTARPFVIPVSDVDHATLKVALGPLTDDQEKYVTRALERLDSNEDDWSLADLKGAILHTEARQDLKRRLLSAIDTLQQRGFFGTKSHEWAIDWERIFSETDTITVFSASLLEQYAHKLLVAAYQARAIFEERKPGPPDVGAHDLEEDAVTSYPRGLVVMREMQGIAPSDSKLKGGSGAETALKNMCIDRMQTLAEERRHVDLGMHGDTQQWFQFNARVRENVDRVLMFNLHAGAAEHIFNKLVGDPHYTHAKTVSEFDVGECCVVGSQWIDTGQPFALPIQWAPPMCHHLDAEDEDQPNGWVARVELLESEEFRESPYTMDGGVEDTVDLEKKEQLQKREQAPDGFETFVDECLQFVDDIDQRVAKAAVRDAYEAFADVHDLETHNQAGQFGRWLRGWYPKDEVDSGKTRGGRGSREDAYMKLRLTTAGATFLDSCHGDSDLDDELIERTAPDSPDDPGGSEAPAEADD